MARIADCTSSALPPVAFIASETPTNTFLASSIVPPEPKTEADNVVNCLVDAAMGTFNLLDVSAIMDKPFSKVA